MKLARRVQQISPFYVMDILARAKGLERQGKDVIHMEIGEPDFPTPPLVVEAAARFIRKADVKYTPASGLPELREAIAEHYLRKYGISVSPNRVLLTPGASGALLLAFSLLLDVGDKVALADPGYPCYQNVIRLLGGLPCPIAVDQLTGFQLTPELLASHWGARMSGVVIASPANPTGSVAGAEALAKLVKFVDTRGGFVISDEIYHGLEYGQRAPSVLEFASQAFVIGGFSKYFGMTGWRLGWLIVTADCAEAAESLAQNLFIAAPTISQVAALAALSDDNRAELERRRAAFMARRDLLCDRLEALGFAARARPAGAFYVYVDCSAFTDDSHRFALGLLSEAHVATTPGVDFGRHAAERFLRFSYTVAEDKINEGLDRVNKFVYPLRQ